MCIEGSLLSCGIFHSPGDISRSLGTSHSLGGGMRLTGIWRAETRATPKDPAVDREALHAENHLVQNVRLPGSGNLVGEGKE